MRLDPSIVVKAERTQADSGELTVLCRVDLPAPHVGDEVQVGERVYRMARQVWLAAPSLGAFMALVQGDR